MIYIKEDKKSAGEIGIKIQEKTRSMAKRIPGNATGTAGWQIAVAFAAGMMTAALAYTTVTTWMLYPRPIEETVIPVAPGAPGLNKPGADPDTGKPVIIELVFTTADEAVVSC